MIDRIRAANADILFVAFGQPKGERWIARHLSRLGVPISVQVGALPRLRRPTGPGGPAMDAEDGPGVGVSPRARAPSALHTICPERLVHRPHDLSRPEVGPCRPPAQPPESGGLTHLTPPTAALGGGFRSSPDPADISIHPASDATGDWQTTRFFPCLPGSGSTDSIEATDARAPTIFDRRSHPRRLPAVVHGHDRKSGSACSTRIVADIGSIATLVKGRDSIVGVLTGLNPAVPIFARLSAYTGRRGSHPSRRFPRSSDSAATRTLDL